MYAYFDSLVVTWWGPGCPFLRPLLPSSLQLSCSRPEEDAEPETVWSLGNVEPDVTLPTAATGVWGLVSGPLPGQADPTRPRPWTGSLHTRRWKPPGSGLKHGWIVSGFATFAIGQKTSLWMTSQRSLCCMCLSLRSSSQARVTLCSLQTWPTAGWTEAGHLNHSPVSWLQLSVEDLLVSRIKLILKLFGLLLHHLLLIHVGSIVCHLLVHQRLPDSPVVDQGGHTRVAASISVRQPNLMMKEQKARLRCRPWPQLWQVELQDKKYEGDGDHQAEDLHQLPGKNTGKAAAVVKKLPRYFLKANLRPIGQRLAWENWCGPVLPYSDWDTAL